MDNITSNRSSTFKTVDSEFYPTWDPKAMPALEYLLTCQGVSTKNKDHLWNKPYWNYVEPCVGEWDLVYNIEDNTDLLLSNMDSFDIKDGTDASTADYHNLCIDNPGDIDLFITNPPWSRKVLKPIFNNLLRHEVPIVMLLPVSKIFNVGDAFMMRYCSYIAPTPRLTWFKDSDQAYTKDTAWFWFDWYETDETFVYRREKYETT